MTTYRPQCKEKVERFSRTINELLQHYVADSPREWDLLTRKLTYASDTQIYRAIGCAPYALTQSIPPQPLGVRPAVQDKQVITASQDLRKQLMQESARIMAKAKQKYEKDFDKQVRSSRAFIEPKIFVFVLKKFYGPHDQKHRLAPVTERSFRVLSTIDTTVVINIDEKQERLSWDSSDGIRNGQSYDGRGAPG